MRPDFEKLQSGVTWHCSTCEEEHRIEQRPRPEDCENDDFDWHDQFRFIAHLQTTHLVDIKAPARKQLNLHMRGSWGSLAIYEWTFNLDKINETKALQSCMNRKNEE